MTRENKGKKGRKKELISLKEFKYVDFSNRKLVTTEDGQEERWNKWRRIPMESLKETAAAYNYFNVFATVQRFCSATPYKNENDEIDEMVIAPLYFDFDASFTLVRSAVLNEKTGEYIPGTDGLVEMEKIRSEELAPYLPEEMLTHIKNFEKGIPLKDEVCEAINKYAAQHAVLSELVWLKNVELSRADAVAVIDFFKSRFALSSDAIRIWFSGSKGFHVIINETAAGIEPLHIDDMKGLMSTVAYELEGLLGLQTLDRQALSSSRRMLRLHNSAHHKSGKWKVEISYDELLLDNVADILRLADKPRQGKEYPIIEELPKNEALAEWVADRLKEWHESKPLRSNQVVLTEGVLAKMEDDPVCVKFILERGILKAGDRNKATIALASYYKDKGLTMDETLAILYEWVKKIPKGMTSSTPAEVRSSTYSAVKTVFSSPKYHFGCAFIRSLHGERRNGQPYEVVPCAGSPCPAHEDHRADEAPATVMHLSRTSNPEYVGKKVATDVLVSGKMDTPYLVPKKVQYVCSHQEHCKKSCIMHQYSGVYEVDLDKNNPILIEMTAQSETMKRGTLRSYIQPGCNKVFPRPLDYYSVTELQVVPMAERVNTVLNEDGTPKVNDNGEGVSVDAEGNEYVLRKIYTTDPDIQANKHYRIEGYVYPNPKNGLATIISSRNQPKEDSIEKFKLTPEIIEQFKVLQVPKGKSLDEHADFIVGDIVNNVTQVYDRDLVHLAILMTYHSCINYYFQNSKEPRGWMEMVMVGDSGQAKSLMVSRLMEFIGLGNEVNAEATSRTGLSYRIEQMSDGKHFIGWGKYPLADRKLLVIDEFSELSREDFGKLTNAREKGVLSVDRVVSAETNARVRLIMMTNPANEATLSEFTYPVEALQKLYSTPADIRRLDLALFLKSGDVPDEVLNKEYEPPENQYIASEVLRNSVLWAWSRKADQIIIERQAMKEILRCANLLGKKYGLAKNLPLCDMGDLRKKIARMSIALAALFHSTDETHERVIVKPEHVRFVAGEEGLVDTLYSMDNCRFDQYNEMARLESELTEEEKEVIIQKLKKVDEDDQLPISQAVLDVLRRNDILRMNEIISMLGYERDYIMKRMKILNEHAMVKSGRGGVRKLPKLISFLNGEVTK